MKLELISFTLCPYVQRSVIVLKQKKVPFELTHIDLENPPEWFLKISPLGQVPVLKVDEKNVIFESSVICEFIDETTPPHLHSADPLTRAHERAWIAYGSELIGLQYQLYAETDEADFKELSKEFFESLARLETVISTGPYFRNGNFSLVDASYAPLFLRLFACKKVFQNPAMVEIPRITAWAKRLLLLPAVKDSVVPDFQEKLKMYFKELGSFAFN